MPPPPQCSATFHIKTTFYIQPPSPQLLQNIHLHVMPHPYMDIHTHAERIKQTVSIDATTVDIEEKGVKLRLTVVDTPGFGDAVDNRQWYVGGEGGAPVISSNNLLIYTYSPVWYCHTSCTHTHTLTVQLAGHYRLCQ